MDHKESMYTVGNMTVALFYSHCLEGGAASITGTFCYLFGEHFPVRLHSVEKGTKFPSLLKFVTFHSLFKKRKVLAVTIHLFWNWWQSILILKNRHTD